MASAIEDCQLGEYVVDDIAILTHIFKIVFWFGLQFWDIADVHVGFITR